LIHDGFDFDCIDAHYYYPDGAAAALLASWFKKPFVVTARGSDLNLLPAYAVPRRWIQWTEAHAAASITVSAALRDRLIDLGGRPDRIWVIRNGVEPELFRPMERAACRERLGLEPGKWLLSVGNLVPEKGHAIAIEALCLMPKDVNLAIVGEGADHGRLASTARKAGVWDRVKLVGFVPQLELPYWYNAADLLVLCSEREGVPNVVLEALRCGTPVVATGVGGIPEVLEVPAAGRVIEARSPQTLALAVMSLLGAKIDKQRVCATASKFSWASATRSQLAVFRKVLGAQPCAIS
jgi:glycosyltransferase involved in cell wall biosynthesis